MNNQDLQNNLTRFQELLYKEIVTPEFLTIPDILGQAKSVNSAVLDQRLLNLAEYKQKEFDELIGLIVTDQKIKELYNSFKMAFLVNTLVGIGGLSGK